MCVFNRETLLLEYCKRKRCWNIRPKIPTDLTIDEEYQTFTTNDVKIVNFYNLEGIYNRGIKFVENIIPIYEYWKQKNISLKHIFINYKVMESKICELLPVYNFFVQNKSHNISRSLLSFLVIQGCLDDHELII